MHNAQRAWALQILLLFWKLYFCSFNILFLETLHFCLKEKVIVFTLSNLGRSPAFLTSDDVRANEIIRTKWLMHWACPFRPETLIIRYSTIWWTGSWSNWPFYSNDLMISSECKNSRWLIKLVVQYLKSNFHNLESFPFFVHFRNIQHVEVYFNKSCYHL